MQLSCSSLASPRLAPLRSARTAKQAKLLVPRGRSTHVDLGGETHETVQSLAHSDDILLHFTKAHAEDEHTHHKRKHLADVMQTNLVTASPDDKLSDVEAKLKGIEGVPVVDAAGKLVGVLSKKDLGKGGAMVKDVMSTKLVSCKAADKVTAAAHAMIDNKIHRVPVVDEEGKCVGLVTRTDIFWALASHSDRSALLHEYGIDV